MARFRLVLVRHGFSLGNERKTLCGWSDVPLTDEGRIELRVLRDTEHYPDTGRYYSSDLRRCKETFRILYGDKARLSGLIPAFREINFGSLEDKSDSHVDFRLFFQSWLSGGHVFDVETYPDFAERVLRAVRELCSYCRSKEQVDSATVITHSGVIRTILIGLGGLDPSRWFTIPTPNGLGYVLELECDDSGVRLITTSSIETAAKSVPAPIPATQLQRSAGEQD